MAKRTVEGTREHVRKIAVELADYIEKSFEETVHKDTDALRDSFTKEVKKAGKYIIVGSDTNRLKSDQRRWGGKSSKYRRGRNDRPIDYAPYHRKYLKDKQGIDLEQKAINDAVNRMKSLGKLR